MASKLSKFENELSSTWSAAPEVNGVHLDAVAREDADPGVDAGRGDERDRLVDRDRPVAARVEDDHLAAGRGLGDRRLEVAARGRPRARVGVASGPGGDEGALRGADCGLPGCGGATA